MANNNNARARRSCTRRHFVSASAAAACGTALFPAGVHAVGSDVLKIGLIGCGSRGTGAAVNALHADRNVRLTTLGDAFRDRLESSLAALRREEGLAQRIDVPQERQFVGFDAYRQVIASGVDAVLLCTPPHFRPAHLRAAVQANKHVFAEKPVAVDAPGVRSVLATVEEARRRRLSIVSGLCLRYSHAYREMVRRLHDGAVGDLVALQANDLRGTIWVRRRQPGWSDMEWQMRNWYYFTWLSGDFNVEQHVHNLDVCAWALRDQYPVRAVGLGGRQVRTGREYGNIYDHFAVVYEYPSGVKVFSQTRQMAGCRGDITVYAVGSRGRAEISERRQVITGASPWQLQGRDNDFYQAEHEALFASIRNSRPLNNGEYMARSTLMAIQARMAAYTGQVVTWEQALHSREDLTPPRYEWGPLAVAPVAMPGVTRLE
jgi:predicted dehydrogenase